MSKIFSQIFSVTIGLVLFFTPAFVHALPPSDAAIVSTLRCVRSLVENYSGGNDGLRVAAGYVDRLMSGEDPSSDCNLKRASLSEVVTTRAHQLAFVNDESSVSPRARKILSTFAKPRAVCEKVGMSAALVGWMAVGANVKIDGAKCLATNGRSWLEIGSGGGWAKSRTVFGITATVNKVQLEREIEPTGIPVDTLTTWSTAAGLFVAGQAESLHEKTEGFDYNGVGLGLGATEGTSHQLNIALIPLGTRDSVLLRLMK